jgi:predicted RNA-binding Zn ribbon-like protein
MHKMAFAFNTTVAALEEELMQLILDGKISARIDSHNKVSCALFYYNRHRLRHRMWQATDEFFIIQRCS